MAHAQRAPPTTGRSTHARAEARHPVRSSSQSPSFRMASMGLTDRHLFGRTLAEAPKLDHHVTVVDPRAQEVQVAWGGTGKATTFRVERGVMAGAREARAARKL